MAVKIDRRWIASGLGAVVLALLVFGWLGGREQPVRAISVPVSLPVPGASGEFK